MKRILSIAIAALLVVSLAAVNTFAGCFSYANGCKTETTVKQADPNLVVKDGVISDGEYVEIEVNRDLSTSDLVISYEKDELYTTAEAFMNNVRFFMSWDSVHGLNVAVEATLLETPVNKSYQPDNDYYQPSQGFPGDEFLFQFGMMFSVQDDSGETTLYRGISRNTDTGEHLYGHYGVHGYTGALNQVAGQDYIVAINGNTVTYEISFPMASVLPANEISGTAPVENTDFLFNVTATGGSKGILHIPADDNELGEDPACYAISLGDYGYMSTAPAGFEAPSAARGVFSSETITEIIEDTPTTVPDPEDPSDTTASGEPIPSDTTESGDPAPSDTTASGEPADTTPGQQTQTPGQQTQTPGQQTQTPGQQTQTPGQQTQTPGQQTTTKPTSPQTGDPMVIAAVVSALSAAGFAISRRRK